MPEHKKQHYVPQFYLKNFSTDRDSLFNYNVKSKKSYKNKIKNIAYSDYFYGKDNGSLELEELLSRIEQEHSIIIKDLIDKKNLNSLTTNDFFYLLNFIMLLQTRTKEARVSVDKFVEMFVADYLKPMIKSEKDFKQYSEEYIDGLKITMPKFFKYPMQIALTMGVIGIFDLKPILIKNKSTRGFITSDAPVAINNYIQIKGYNLTGYQSPGLQIFCPLDLLRYKIL